MVDPKLKMAHGSICLSLAVSISLTFYDSREIVCAVVLSRNQLSITSATEKNPRRLSCMTRYPECTDYTEHSKSPGKKKSDLLSSTLKALMGL